MRVSHESARSKLCATAMSCGRCGCVSGPVPCFSAPVRHGRTDQSGRRGLGVASPLHDTMLTVVDRLPACGRRSRATTIAVAEPIIFSKSSTSPRYPLRGRTHYPPTPNSPSTHSARPHRDTRPTVRVTSPTRSDQNACRLHLVVRERPSAGIEIRSSYITPGLGI
ncbi:hypothetical protein EV363DRAFT_1349341 [Boletus edulis]|nr:hypothetical protein EV363DRAFT_1349341 [Boletus edulis]